MCVIRRLTRLALIGWLCLSPILAAYAQASGPVVVYFHTIEPPEVVDNNGALLLTFTFSLLQTDGQVKRNIELEQANLFVGPDIYEVHTDAVSKANPWSVVILVDNSKTLADAKAGPAYKNARNLLAEAMKNHMPSGASVSVLAFNDKTPILFPFSNNVEAAGETIRQLAPTTGNSCLYNGVFEAIVRLSDTPGQRAVVIFTASEDNCFSRTAPEVVEFAKQNHVQLYAVGLNGYTTTLADLDNLTRPTGGLASMHDENTLSFGLNNAFITLSEQWRATVKMYPTAGEQTGTLRLTLKDKTVIESEPIRFNSPQNFPRPASVQLTGKVQSTSTGLTFFLSYTNRERIAALDVAVISNETGQPINEQRLTGFGDTNPLAVSNLESGKEYTLRVQARDAQGGALGEAALQEFKYEPPLAHMAIAQVSPPSYDDPQVVITLTQQNLEGAVKFKIWLMTAQNKALVPETEQTIPVGESLIIPIEPDELETGEYLVGAQALAADGTLLAEAEPATTAYTRPTSRDLFIRWLKESPWAIAGLTGVCCLGVAVLLGVVWLVLPKPSAKPKAVDLALPEKRRAGPTLEESAIYSSGIRERPSVPQAQAVAAQPAVPTARIVAVAPAEIKFTAQIQKTPFTIGRRDANDAVLPVPNSSGVSGQHCTITYTSGAFYIQDNNSTYGTTLNGQAIPKGQPMRLENGAVIGLGPKVQIRFSLT